MIKKKSFLPPPYNHKGFTLAETLITLVIVGVVAALTVPTIITKYQKEQTVTRLKKVYSALAQTTNRAITDHGPINTWTFGSSDSSNDAKIFLNQFIIPYMNVMKLPTTSSEGNWNNSYTTLSNNQTTYSENSVRFYLTDGTAITTSVNSNTANKKRLLIMVDINGDKKPNIYGKDIFQLSYYIVNSSNPELNGKFVPTGFQNSREEILSSGTYTCNKNATGTHCMALIMKDGWQIKDDYPW